MHFTSRVSRRLVRDKISWKFDLPAITERQRDQRGRSGTQETHARTSPAFMCPSKRGDASTGLFVGFSRIPDVSAESFVPFARYAIEYFRDVFRLVSDSRIFIPLFLLDSVSFAFTLSLSFPRRVSALYLTSRHSRVASIKIQILPREEDLYPVNYRDVQFR